MRKNLHSRIIAVLLISVMSLSLSACGGNKDADKSKDTTKKTATNKTAENKQQEKSNFNKTGLPIVDQPVEYTVFYAPASGLPTKPMKEKPFFKRMEKETNVKIKWNEVPNSAATEKLNVIMNSGDLPDAVLTGGVPNMSNYIQTGQILAIDDYLEYAPNTAKLINNYPEVKNAITYVDDNKMYAFPAADRENFSRVGNPMFINKKWLDAVGMDAPTNTDELLEVFKAFKTKDPNGNNKADEIPLGMCKTWFGLEVYRMYPIWDMQPPIGTPIDVSIRDGKVEFNPVSDNFKSFLNYMHTLYKEGYMEVEALTQDNKTFKAKASEKPGKYGMFFSWLPEMVSGMDLMDEYELLLPLEGPFGTRKFNCTSKTKPIRPNFGLTLLEPCENPEIIARWYDYIMTGKNSLEVYAGEEGIGYTVDEDAKTWKVNVAKMKELGVSFGEYRVDVAVQATLGSRLPDIIGYTQQREEGSTQVRKEVWSKAYDPFAMNINELWPATTPITSPTEEAQEVALLQADIETYVDAFVADMIINGLDDNKWEKHINKCNDYKYKDIISYYQKLYDTYKY